MVLTVWLECIAGWAKYIPDDEGVFLFLTLSGLVSSKRSLDGASANCLVVVPGSESCCFTGVDCGTLAKNSTASWTSSSALLSVAGDSKFPRDGYLGVKKKILARLQ